MSALTGMLAECSDKQKDLVLEVLKHSDKKVLTLINDYPASFMDMINSDGQRDGTKWDDIIIHVEDWDCFSLRILDAWYIGCGKSYTHVCEEGNKSTHEDCFGVNS